MTTRGKPRGINPKRRLKATSKEAFESVVKNQEEDESLFSSAGEISTCPAFPVGRIRDLSAREIEEIADKALKKEIQAEQDRLRISPRLNTEIKVFLMNRLGIPIDLIAVSLRLSRNTAY